MIAYFRFEIITKAVQRSFAKEGWQVFNGDTVERIDDPSEWTDEFEVPYLKSDIEARELAIAKGLVFENPDAPFMITGYDTELWKPLDTFDIRKSFSGSYLLQVDAGSEEEAIAIAESEDSTDIRDYVGQVSCELEEEPKDYSECWHNPNPFSDPDGFVSCSKCGNKLK